MRSDAKSHPQTEQTFTHGLGKNGCLLVLQLAGNTQGCCFTKCSLLVDRWRPDCKRTGQHDAA
eukprot:3232245-Amphidinium_carterae.3